MIFGLKSRISNTEILRIGDTQSLCETLYLLNFVLNCICSSVLMSLVTKKNVPLKSRTLKIVKVIQLIEIAPA